MHVLNVTVSAMTLEEIKQFLVAVEKEDWKVDIVKEKMRSSKFTVSSMHDLTLEGIKHFFGAVEKADWKFDTVKEKVRAFNFNVSSMRELTLKGIKQSFVDEIDWGSPRTRLGRIRTSWSDPVVGPTTLVCSLTASRHWPMIGGTHSILRCE